MPVAKIDSLRWLAALALAAVTALAAAEPAVTVRQVELRQTPAADAASLATVPAETAVELVKREGAWVQLKAGKMTGWAKLFDIRFPGAGTKAGSNGNSITQALNLAAGNRGSSVTTGVRGLDEDTLKKATPNPAEVVTLQGYATNKEQARAFASAGRLAARDVEPLKVAK